MSLRESLRPSTSLPSASLRTSRTSSGLRQRGTNHSNAVFSARFPPQHAECGAKRHLYVVSGAPVKPCPDARSRFSHRPYEWPYNENRPTPQAWGCLVFLIPGLPALRSLGSGGPATAVEASWNEEELDGLLTPGQRPRVVNRRGSCRIVSRRFSR